MNLRTRFNRLGASLTLGLAIAGTSPAISQSSAVQTVPPGQNPPDLQRIYDRLSARSSLPNLADFRIASSITALSNIPDNEWLRSLKNLPPEQAEQEVKACLNSLCEYKYPFLSPADSFIARVMVLEAMFHNGLDQEEFRTYSEFLSRFEADPAFYNRDRRVIDNVVSAIYESPAYRNVRERLVPLAQVTSENAEGQFHLRRNLMQYVSDVIRAQYGYAQIPVYLDKFPAQLNSTAAITISEKYTGNFPDTAAVLYNYQSSADNPASIIEYMAHETRHSTDFAYRRELLGGQISSDDPRFSHTVVINLNENAVVPLCAVRTLAQNECPEQYNWYRHQYRERSAVDFAKKISERFRQEIQRRESVRTSGSLKTQKLQLPA